MKNFEDRCADAGLKITDSLKPIVDSLLSFNEHPSVEDVYERAVEADPSVKIDDVYRLLDQLQELELVIRNDFLEGYSRYEVIQVAHQLVDLDSGEIIECDASDIEKLKQKAAG